MPEFIDEADMSEYREKLQELLDLSEGLWDGELDFIESLADWEGNFTLKQANWLNKIYERLLG